MRITFLGAAETVTGSRFLVDVNDSRILVDCGLFQGVKRLRLKNWEPCPADPASIDAVVITHAHIDHTGYLPSLVRDGFAGDIWCTPGTAALSDILLPDTAYLQEEEARYANKRRSSRHHPALPRFTQADAAVALSALRTAEFGEAFEPAPGVEVRFSRAGHILGASSVWLSDGSKSVVFSGDLGRDDDLVMNPPEPPPSADHLVIESTYGDRSHPDEDPREVIARTVSRTAERGGIVLIPVFAVGRAQTILHVLAELRRDGRIPTVPVHLNSPMAINATELFLAAPREHRLSDSDLDELCEGVQFTRSVEDSQWLTSQPGPRIILSASGMITGGRVLHHLVRVLPDRRSTIVITGYQATGTRGASLLQGAESLRIFGEDVPVRCEVVRVDSLSAHADADGLLQWVRSAPVSPTAVSVVHGEAGAADTLRRRIQIELGLEALVPAIGDSVVV